MYKQESIDDEWKQELINKLFPIKAKDIDMDGALQLKYKKIPKNLYRYRPFENRSIKNYNPINELKEEVIWLNSADGLNDPFECMYKVGSSAFLEIYAKAHGTPAPLEIKKDLEKFCRSIPGHDESIELLKESTYICCFSELNDSKLMWSHYADSHKGFCIEYDFKNEHTDEELKQNLFPVLYREELFDIVPYGLKNDDLNPLIEIYLAMFKEISWKYEQEWRLIFPMGKSESFSRRGPTISAIYLGAKIDEENKQKLIEIARAKDIDVYQMEIDGYNLNSNLIEKKD
ncbi:DUF2971 domain-containing protein [Methanococcus maripaludis]|uniref:DUF2971 family protein n=1 Tax=Methanococcus maripaludis TaxID=39152 RepID=A0A7J9S1Q4_METMI|nr:DUF2971 domain-containing protein [Methanococcus maripaludis]MBB6068183.1 hypothetical protein [Methanococcus maripaludis]